MSVLLVFLIGNGVAVYRRRLRNPAEHRYTPARLAGWAATLAAATRTREPDPPSVPSPTTDWRFALRRVSAALVRPPRGAAAVALAALTVIAAVAAGLVLYTKLHYRLPTDGWTWVTAAILTILLIGYPLGGGALLRRPGVAGPGLTGGLLLAAAWMTVGGFTFDRWLNSLGTASWLVILAPLVIGVGGTLWTGDATTGRRVARLASVTAALTIYLYGVLAVAIHGGKGHDPSDGLDDGPDRRRQPGQPSAVLPHRAPPRDRDPGLGRRRSHRPVAPPPAGPRRSAGHHTSGHRAS